MLCSDNSVIKALVVEDDPLTHTSIIKMLEAVGLTVLGSRNGRIGLDILERHPDISLLVCDIMMDGMDGRTLIKRIRAMPEYQELPILIVSGIVSRDEVDDLLDLGPGAYLEKPIGARAFFEDLKPYCDYDPHVGPTRSYEIASTYYDTRSLQFYVDREESVGYRRKIRLRAYNTDGNSTALFIEIKEKHKQYVSKKRINLRSMDVLSCGIPHIRLSLDMIANELEDSAEAREIIYLHKRLQLFPTVIIRYLRIPDLITTCHEKALPRAHHSH